MWRPVKAGVIAVAGALMLVGCSPPPPRQVNMELSALNTADRILVIEGQTDLPSGAPLVAEFQDMDGKTLLKDRGVVRGGSFFFDFDLGRLSEFSSYQVEVTFDPEAAPLGVRLHTGLWGEALEGDGVRRLGEKRVYLKRREIHLSASALGRVWEGRDFEEMEAGERSRLIAELERYVEEKPDDRPAKLSLARAYLADDPREHSSGSRAHMLLTEAARAPETDRDGARARELLAEIESREKRKQARAAQQKALAEGDRYREDLVVVPGMKLGGFRMDTPFNVVGRYFKLDRQVDFGRAESDPTVRLVDFHDIELTFDLLSRRLVAARTTSPKFRLPEGFGVGSLLQELQKAYGMDTVYTPEFEPLETRPDGTRVFLGRIETDGLRLEIRREVDPEFGIPVDKVSALTIFKR